jgi:hypothetical protein
MKPETIGDRSKFGCISGDVLTCLEEGNGQLVHDGLAGESLGPQCPGSLKDSSLHQISGRGSASEKRPVVLLPMDADLVSNAINGENLDLGSVFVMVVVGVALED